MQRPSSSHLAGEADTSRVPPHHDLRTSFVTLGPSCLVEKLASSRGALQVEPQKDGMRVIVPQKFSSGPAAVFDIEDRSGGSSIKLHDAIPNVPFPPWDLRNSPPPSISGGWRRGG